MAISKEAKVGALGVVALVILYFGFNFLKGSDVFSRSNEYYVQYDNIDGLAPSNPVLLNGLPVGRVIEIVLLPERHNHLKVTLDVQKTVKLPVGTKAVLADGGVLGGKVIHLKVGPDPENILPEGAELPAEKQPGLLALLQEKALPVLSHADSLLLSLTAVSAGFQETGQTLNQVLHNFDESSRSLKGILSENREKLAGLMNNMNALSASLVETEKSIKPLLSGATTLVDSLKALQLGQTVQQANATLASLRKLVSNLEGGDGTAGKLLTDEKLYNNLNYTLISLNQLLANFREHPKRYINVSVFGRKNDKGPAESPIDTVLKFKEPN